MYLYLENVTIFFYYYYSRSQLNTSSQYHSLLQSSHILEETAGHIVEAFGATLPVTVTEILTLSESKFFWSHFGLESSKLSKN